MQQRVLLSGLRCSVAGSVSASPVGAPLRTQISPFVQDLLSQPELDAAREYDELLETYMHAVGTDLCKCMQPPKSVRVAVKVKENWG